MKSKQAKRSLAVLAALFVASNSFASSTIIARLNPGFDPHIIAATLGITYLDSSPGGRYTLFGTASEEQSELVEAQLISTPNPMAAWAEDDDELTVTESTNGKGGSVPQLQRTNIQTQFSQGSAYSENTFMLRQIRWNYELPTRKSSVRVAILDTGLSPLQPAIWNRVVASATMNPRETNVWDYRLSPGTYDSHRLQDIAGHGTMIAGLIYLLAPDSELIIVRICDNFGFSDSWRVIKGIGFALENGATLANLSFGSPLQAHALKEVIEDAEAEGLLCVAPLGNNARQMALYPARENQTLAVSGVDHLDLKASFSNWHFEADMSAPATGIRSAWWNGQMAVWHGTSFAVPIVTGCLAEALKNRGPVIPEDIIGAVNQMGDNIDPLNPNYQGRLGRRINMMKMRAAIKDLP